MVLIKVPRRNGFTLLEVMVVLLLIGILTGFAVLSVRGVSEDERLAEEARRLAALLEFNHQEAVLGGEERGVHFEENGYTFMILNRTKEWVPVQDSPLLTRHQLPRDFNIDLWVDGRLVDLGEPSPSPQILLLSSGESTDFKLVLGAEYVRGYTVSGDALGNLQLGAVR